MREAADLLFRVQSWWKSDAVVVVTVAAVGSHGNTDDVRTIRHCCSQSYCSFILERSVRTGNGHLKIYECVIVFEQCQTNCTNSHSFTDSNSHSTGGICQMNVESLLDP